MLTQRDGCASGQKSCYLPLALGHRCTFLCCSVVTGHMTECAEEEKKSDYTNSWLHSGPTVSVKIATGVPWLQRGRELGVCF